MPTFEYRAETTAKLVDYIRGKRPPRVVVQTPPPGTPVIEGMTIQVHAISESDVPIFVLDQELPPLVKDVPIADIADLIESDPDILKAVTEGRASATVTEKVNLQLRQRGVTGSLSAAETETLVKSLKGLGFGAR